MSGTKIVGFLLAIGLLATGLTVLGSIFGGLWLIWRCIAALVAQ